MTALMKSTSSFYGGGGGGGGKFKAVIIPFSDLLDRKESWGLPLRDLKSCMSFGHFETVFLCRLSQSKTIFTVRLGILK